MVRQPVAEPVEAHQPSKSRWNFIYKSHYLGELYTIFHQILSIKNFFKVWTSFSQSGTLFFQYRNFFFTRKISSRRLRGARLRPWALEAPLPLGELSLSGILQLWNQRFQVSGMQSPMSLGSSASFRRIVPSRDTSTMESEIPSFRDAL